MLVSRGRGVWISVALASLVLAGCGTRMTRAPVEDRGTAVAAQPGEVVASPVVKTLPGAENAGRPGYYTVKLAPPVVVAAAPVVQDSGGVVTRPVTVSSVAPAAPSAAASAAPAPKQGASNAVPPPTPVVVAPAPVPAAPTGGEDELGFIWPASGS